MMNGARLTEKTAGTESMANIMSLNSIPMSASSSGVAARRHNQWAA